jgi:hypothetical protein
MRTPEWLWSGTPFSCHRDYDEDGYLLKLARHEIRILRTKSERPLSDSALWRDMHRRNPKSYRLLPKSYWTREEKLA